MSKLLQRLVRPAHHVDDLAARCRLPIDVVVVVRHLDRHRQRHRSTPMPELRRTNLSTEFRGLLIGAAAGSGNAGSGCGARTTRPATADGNAQVVSDLAWPEVGASAHCVEVALDPVDHALERKPLQDRASGALAERRSEFRIGRQPVDPIRARP